MCIALIVHHSVFKCVIVVILVIFNGNRRYATTAVDYVVFHSIFIIHWIISILVLEKPVKHLSRACRASCFSFPCSAWSDVSLDCLGERKSSKITGLGSVSSYRGAHITGSERYETRTTNLTPPPPVPKTDNYYIRTAASIRVYMYSYYRVIYIHYRSEIRKKKILKMSLFEINWKCCTYLYGHVWSI